jgi:hypothetical protein
MFLTLDPSSTRTGYAAWNDDWSLREAGYFGPTRMKDIALDRIDAMIRDLEHFVVEKRPRLIVIEIPSGKVGSGQRRGAGASLTIYGFAAGAVYAWCRTLSGVDVRTATERAWTNRVPKAKRAKLIAMEFPQYAKAMELDGGGDVADAIGLGLWFRGAEKRREMGVA